SARAASQVATAQMPPARAPAGQSGHSWDQAVALLPSEPLAGPLGNVQTAAGQGRAAGAGGAARGAGGGRKGGAWVAEEGGEGAGKGEGEEKEEGEATAGSTSTSLDLDMGVDLEGARLARPRQRLWRELLRQVAHCQARLAAGSLSRSHRRRHRLEKLLSLTQCLDQLQAMG
ncbi:hypothetical protein QJQ45_014311, partial [Haematococcus lacustris]